MRFYDVPLNYYNNRSPAKIADNRYTTHITDLQFVVTIDSVGDESGTARVWDTLYLRGHNITSFDIVNVIGPTAVPTHTPSPADVPLDIDGQTSYIYREPTPRDTFKHLRINVVYGTGGYLSQVMVLNTLVDLSDAAFEGYLSYEINPLPAGSIIESAAKRKSWIPPLLDTRNLREVSLQLRFNQQISEHVSEYNKLRHLMQTHRHGFVFEPDYNFHPEFVAPCVFAGNQQQRYLSRVKSSGRLLNFSVLEQ